jgi:hypothetical protein
MKCVEQMRTGVYRCREGRIGPGHSKIVKHGADIGRDAGDG